jgi:phytoene dehydrogenase-like protein
LGNLELNRVNSIIIGAGHNGLVCAAYLAKKGQSVLVLESSDRPGGLAATREFHPGFRASVAHSVNHFPRKIVKDLGLDAHGLGASKEPLPTVGLSPDGNHVVLSQNKLTGVGENDTKAYQQLSSLMQRFADTLKPFWLKTIPRVGINSLADLLTLGRMGLNVRMLGKTDMREFLRITALPPRDLMDENFDHDILKAMLSWDGLIGSKLAPRSPNHAVLAMLYRRAGEQYGSVGGLINALYSAANASGAEIRTGTAVERILVQADDNGLTAHGVKLANGETIEADRVISAADPQTTFLKLVGGENLEIECTNRIRRLRCEGYVAKLHLALSDLPEFKGLPEPGGRLIIAPDMDAIEFAYDDAKYGECSAQPVMEILMPSMYDDSLAPPGQHVLSAHVMYAPYQQKGGWDEAKRAMFAERVIDTIARYAPGISEQIIHSELLTPKDLEQGFNVTGGHWHHTEFALDQALMMRPTYEAAQYSTPIPGLYLCGAGSHPGGDLTGGPGHNAAHEILRRHN